MPLALHLTTTNRWMIFAVKSTQVCAVHDRRQPLPVCREREAGEIGCDFCHSQDCSVEAELGRLGGVKMT